MEEWKDIKCYEGLYQISNKGRIKSLPKKGSGGHNGKIFSIGKRRLGYGSIMLTKDKIQKTFLVHRLVAQGFLGLDINNPKILVCHKKEILIDGFLDNSSENLFLGTVKDNHRDMENKGRSYFQKSVKELIKQGHSIEKFDRYDNYNDSFTLY